jgi:cation diffusion facilitator family transporter
MSKRLSDVRVVTTSLVVSFSDVVLNLLVAFMTGSAVMLAQALQGMSDLITGGLLLLGVKRSRRAADVDYQFGYGREIFFWVLMAGLLMFLGTGGLSLYFGYQQLVRPGVITNVYMAVAMLTFGLISNAYAFSLSVRRLRQAHRGAKWWRQLRRSSIVETKATLMVDLLGTTAAVLGFVSISVFLLTGNERFDGVGSILIGLMMMVASTILIWDVRDLIVGRAVGPGIAHDIMRAAKSVDGVNDVLDLRTMYLGSNKLLVIIEVHVQDDLNTDEIEKVTDRVKQLVHDTVPEANQVQVEVETPD